MADNAQAYLDQLEEEYNKPIRIRNLMPKPSAGLAVSVNLAAGQLNPVNAGPINFTVTFNKVVTGFTNADVSFTGSTVGGTLAAAVTGTGPAYNVAVTGMTGNGLVAVSIPAGAAQDATGIDTPASIAAFVTFDTAAPSVTINQAAGQVDPAVLPPINFTAVFSEAVINFVSADVTITGTAGGTKVVTVTGGPSTYNVAVTGMSTGGTVIADIAAGVCTDLAGNANTISTSTDKTVTWTPDTVAPTVTINVAGGQADPTSVSPILFTAVFSEAVIGFTAADISFTGSTVGGTLAAVITGTGPTYTVTVTGMTTAGDVTASIPAGSVTDPSGNANTASTSTDNTVAWTVAGPGTGDGTMDFSNPDDSGLLILLQDI